MRPVPPVWMGDFDVYLQAFQRAASGGDPYAIRTAGIDFLYPPPALFVVGFFAAIPAEQWRTATFFAINLVLLGWMVWGIARRYDFALPEIWWWFPLAFGFAPFHETLLAGQINLITLFGVFAMFVYTARSPAGAGIGLWLAIVTKVTPLAYFGYLLAARRARVLVLTIIFLGVSIALSALLFGPKPLFTFLEILSGLQTRFFGERDAQALVSLFVANGWLEQGAWLLAQDALNWYVGVILVTSCALAWRARQTEPSFLTASLGTTILTNALWYNRYVWLLLPIFVWMAWSRFHRGVVVWSVTGLVITQIDRAALTDGMLIHLFVHLSLVGILAWQFAQAFRARDLARVPMMVLLAGALFWIVAFPLRNAITLSANLRAARTWIEATLPAQSRLALDATAPRVSADRFVVERFQTLGALAPEWFAQNGFEYVVLGDNVTRAGIIAGGLERLKQFQDGEYVVAIYRTNALRLPRYREAKRFGIFSEWFELVGYDLESLRAEFFWRPLRQGRERIRLTVRVIDPLDRLVEQADVPLFAATGEQWPVGIVGVPIQFASRDAVGWRKIELALEGESSGAIPLLSATREPMAEKMILGPLKVPASRPSPEELARAKLVNAQIGKSVILARYAINPIIDQRGDTFEVTLYWECQAKVEKDYTVFVHLLDTQGNLVAQIDAQPRGGAYPTSIWDAGEIIRDDYKIVVPRDRARGKYRIAVGMYESSSFARSPVNDATGKSIGDVVLLDDIVTVK